MEKLKEYGEYVPHIKMAVRHIYYKDGEKIFVKIIGANGENLYQITTESNVKVELVIDVDGMLIKNGEVPISDDSSEIFHIKSEDELKWLEEIAQLKIEWPSQKAIDDGQKSINLEKKEIKKLKTFFEKNGCIIQQEGTGIPYALEINKNGTSIRIYVDPSEEEGTYTYQAISSLNPLSLEKDPCNTYDTLLKSVDEIIEDIKYIAKSDMDTFGYGNDDTLNE